MDQLSASGPLGPGPIPPSPPWDSRSMPNGQGPPRPHQGPTLQPCNPRKYLPSPPQAALGVTVTSRQESDSEL